MLEAKLALTWPEELDLWAKHYRIADRLPKSVDVRTLISQDVNAPLTQLGSTFLHLALTNAPYPHPQVCMPVLRFLIVDCGADLNRVDEYGRTPFTMLVAEATPLWSAHPYYAPWGSPAHGVELVKLMLERGADPDVLYSPRTPQWAGCSQWRLIHECAYGEGRAYLPDEMREILARCWNANLPDSEGRVAGAGETVDLFAGVYRPSLHIGLETRLESEAERRALSQVAPLAQ